MIEVNKEFIDSQNAYQSLFEGAASLTKVAMIYPKVFADEKFKRFHGYFDRILYATLHLTDLIMGLKHLHEALGIGSQFEQRYFARVLSLTLWNILQSPSKVMDKP